MESSIFTLTVSGQNFLQYFIMVTSGSEVASTLTCSYETRRGDEAVETRRGDEAVDVDVAVHDPPLRSYPVLHDAHLAFPFVGQAAPVAPTPLSHVHERSTHEPPLRSYLVLHDAHLALLLVHADPVAGDPLLQVHVYVAVHEPPLREYPALHELQIWPWWLVHADPVAGDPFSHVHDIVGFLWHSFLPSMWYPFLQVSQSDFLGPEHVSHDSWHESH
jgi:hypothetical protein